MLFNVLIFLYCVMYLFVHGVDDLQNSVSLSGSRYHFLEHLCHNVNYKHNGICTVVTCVWSESKTALIWPSENG